MILPCPSLRELCVHTHRLANLCDGDNDRRIGKDEPTFLINFRAIELPMSEILAVFN